MVATENGTLPITAEPSQSKIANGRTKRRWEEELSNRHADLLLLLCCLVSGLVDSTIYNAYGTFVSMQTGNTIFVGLGGSTPHTTQKPYGWAKSLTSIGCFVLGALFFSNFCRYFGPLRRSTLIHSFLIQSLMIIFTAAIIAGGIVDGTLPRQSQEIEWRQEIPIALLSFQSAGQMVGSRILSISEIPTLVVTSVLCDFASDPALAAPLTGNIKRNRRALGFFGILAGAVAGGWISREAGEIHSVLWMAAGIKVFITASWVFWPKAEKAETAAV